MRKKALMSSESRYYTMIENAYYYSNPPSNTSIVREPRPPKHEYIRKLIYRDLNKVTVERVSDDRQCCCISDTRMKLE